MGESMPPYSEKFLVWGFPVALFALAAMHAWRPERKVLGGICLLVVTLCGWLLVEGIGGSLLGAVLVLFAFVVVPAVGAMLLAGLGPLQRVPVLLFLIGPLLYWAFFFGTFSILGAAGVLR